MATKANRAWWDALTAEQQKRVMQQYIIRRLGTPDDAAHAVKFLANERAGWITSQTLPVNGGFSAAL
jgi:3-oxoacyl-[acyl-carrier protein] reductase